MESDKENAESSIYQDMEDFDLGSEVEKLKAENKVLQNHIINLEGDVDKLASALVELKSLQENLTKNISSLYMTAKAEIERKDRIIADLRGQLDDIAFRRMGIRNPKRKPDETLQVNNKKVKQGSENCFDQQTTQEPKDDGDVISIEKQKHIPTVNERDKNISSGEMNKQSSSYQESYPYRDNGRSYRDYGNKSRSRDRRKEYDYDHIHYGRNSRGSRGIGHRYNDFEIDRQHRTDYGDSNRMNNRSEYIKKNRDEDEPHCSRRKIHSENDAAIQNNNSSHNESTKSSCLVPRVNRKMKTDLNPKEDRKKLKIIHRLEKEKVRKKSIITPNSSFEEISISSSKNQKEKSKEIENIASDFIHDMMDNVQQSIHKISPGPKSASQFHNEESREYSKTEKHQDKINTENTKKVTKANQISDEMINIDYSSRDSGIVKYNIMKHFDMMNLLKKTLITPRDEKRFDDKLDLDQKSEAVNIVDEDVSENNEKSIISKQYNNTYQENKVENEKSINDLDNKLDTDRKDVAKNDDIIPHMNPSYKIPKKDPKLVQQDYISSKYNPLEECDTYGASKRNNIKSWRLGQERSRDTSNRYRSRSESRIQSESEERYRSKSRVKHERCDDKHRGRSKSRRETNSTRSKSIEAENRRKNYRNRQEIVNTARLDTKGTVTDTDRTVNQCRSPTPMSFEKWTTNETPKSAECDLEDGEIFTDSLDCDEFYPIRDTQTNAKKIEKSIGNSNTQTNNLIINSQNITHTQSSTNHNIMSVQKKCQRISVDTASSSISEVPKNELPMEWKIHKIEDYIATYSSSKNNESNKQLCDISLKSNEDETNSKSKNGNEQKLLNKEQEQTTDESNAKVVEECQHSIMKGIELDKRDLLKQTAADNKSNDITKITNMPVIMERKEVITEITENVCHVESKKSKSIIDNEIGNDNIADFSKEKASVNVKGKPNQDTTIATNVELENISPLEAESTEPQQLKRISRGTITTHQTSKSKLENYIINGSVDEKDMKIEELTTNATINACKINSPAILNGIVDLESESSVSDKRDSIDVMKTTDASLPLHTKPMQLDSLPKIPAKSIVTSPNATDKPRTRSKYRSSLAASKIEEKKSKNVEKPELSEDLFEIIDKKSNVGDESQTQNDGSVDKNQKSEKKSKISTVTSLQNSSKNPKTKCEVKAPTTKRRKVKENKNKVKSAKEDRKQKLETVINKISKRRSSEATDVTESEKTKTIGDSSERVNVESPETNELFSNPVTQPTSEASISKTFRKETPTKNLHESNPVNSANTSIEKQTVLNQITTSHSQTPIRRRINPIKVEDSPVCSFENILGKKQSPFSTDFRNSPLSLTHEGEIPVLHLEENHFNELKVDGKINDPHIISLLDQISISNMDTDLSKFVSVHERTEGIEPSSKTPANFENVITTAAVENVSHREDSSTTQMEKDIKNVTPPSGQNTPFVRGRRRCRLVVLK